MSKTLYPLVITDSQIPEVVREMVRLREQDVDDFTNLSQVFLGGRTGVRVPSSPSDVLATDNVGDVVNDDTYEYKLVQITGGALWDRRTLDVAW